jgi:hypothetical protein
MGSDEGREIGMFRRWMMDDELSQRLDNFVLMLIAE